MIRYGIVSREQVLSKGMVRRLRRFPLIAFTILREFDKNLSVSDEKLLNLIYRSIQAGPHIKKGTFPGRYKTVDVAIVEEIEKVFPDDHPLRVHDMGASNAITSLEFFECLRHRDNVRVHASDYYDGIYVVAVPRSRWKVIFDAADQPLQFVGVRMVIPASRIRMRERLRYPINWVIQRTLFATVLPEALRIMRTDRARNEDRVERIELFHPKCIATARDDSRFTLGRDNLLAPAAGSYEVVRVMGVVEYFPRDLIEPMFRAVCEHIVDGGLLVVASRFLNHDPTRVFATIFQRQGERFSVIRNFHNGHPHRELILSLRLAMDARSA